MFLGHFAAAFVLKRVEPRVRLGTLFFAALLVDVAWGGFLLAGWERARIWPGYLEASHFEFLEYPITHSLVAAFLWAAGTAFIYYSKPTRDTSRHHYIGALVVGLAAASHWFLDLVVHTRDLPLAGADSARVGLGLWASLPATLAVEFGLLAGGVAVYLGFRRRGHTGSLWRTLVLAAGLAGIYLVSVFGPAPPSLTLVGAVALATGPIAWLLGNWVDVKLPDRGSRG